MIRAGAVIARNDLALLRQDPTAPIILLFMPVILVAFFKPAWRPVLHQEGYLFANGAEQAVPGTAVMFAFFMVSFAGVGFFREHVWDTWDRLRTLPIKPRAIISGKVALPFVLIALQQALLFTIGATVFKLHVRGPLYAFALTDLAFVLWLTAFIFATVTFCRTFQQVLAVSNLGAMVFAGLGGALTPISTLPSWARAIAPATPIYWTMKAFNHVTLDGQGIGGIAVSLAVLGGTAVVIAAIAAARFRLDAEKGKQGLT